MDNSQFVAIVTHAAKAYLDWRVKKEPAMHDGQLVEDAFYTVREDTDAVLGMLGA